MAINTATGKRPAKVTPANKVGSRTKEEIVYVERPSIQQKSSINLEQEREEAFIREITDLVHKEENASHLKQLNRILKNNKRFKAVLQQVHRVDLYPFDGKVRERYIPQSKLVFETDDDYYHWAMTGGFDKDLNDDFDYIVLRRIISNKEA
jgi:hypothetical protein